MDETEPLQSPYSQAEGGCVLIIPIERKWLSFFMSNLLPGVIIVIGGLSALFLDPTSPPLIGVCSALFSLHFLLCITYTKHTHCITHFTGHITTHFTGHITM